MLFTNPGELRIYANCIETTAQNMFIGEVAAIPTTSIRQIFVKGRRGFKVTHTARGIVETLSCVASDAKDAQM